MIKIGNTSVYNIAASSDKVISIDGLVGNSEPAGEIIFNIPEIKTYAFYGTPITKINGNTLTTIRDYAFQNCKSLTEIDLPNVTAIYGYAFDGCSNLETVNVPQLQSMGGVATFQNCTKLTSFNAPNLTSGLSSYCFRYCSALVEARFPKMAGGLGQVFNPGCSNLEILDLGLCNNLGSSAFDTPKLTTLILRRTTIPSLGSGGLGNSPFKNGNAGGTIYIPKVLYDHLGDGSNLDYKAASNWSTYDGYGTITWAQIEGSIWEL